MNERSSVNLHFHLQQFYALACKDASWQYAFKHDHQITVTNNESFFLITVSSNQSISIEFSFWYKLRWIFTMEQHYPKPTKPNSTASLKGQGRRLTPYNTCSFPCSFSRHPLLQQALHITPTTPLQEVKKTSPCWCCSHCHWEHGRWWRQVCCQSHPRKKHHPSTNWNNQSWQISFFPRSCH